MPTSYRSAGTVVPGLCGRCRHALRVQTDRGAIFYQCLRARTDASFARYPVLPVRECRGYEPDERPVHDPGDANG